jgi:hypothetical protein
MRSARSRIERTGPYSGDRRDCIVFETMRLLTVAGAAQVAFGSRRPTLFPVSLDERHFT